MRLPHFLSAAPSSSSLPALVLVLAGAAAGPAWAQSCSATSGPRPPAVVELFTSQGCSSCPPADRWLSTLKGQEGVLALGFHVNYWNHLGWKDPYATAETTQRQRQIQAAIQANNVYTPQIVLNGRDHRAWRSETAKDLPNLPAQAAPQLRLSREGNQVTATIAAGSTHQLAGYWAVLQDGLSSDVTRGENAGEKLRNDHVVGLYQPVAAWAAKQAHTETLTLGAGAGQRVVFVVTNSGWTQPVQALALSCKS